MFVASKQSGVTSMQDLIDKSKAKPGSITYGTEMGSFSHVQGLMLEKLTDIKLKMVDGGTVSDRVVGMLGGRLDLGAITYGSVQDYVSGGQMVALGQPTTSATRCSATCRRSRSKAWTSPWTSPTWWPSRRAPTRPS